MVSSSKKCKNNATPLKVGELTPLKHKFNDSKVIVFIGANKYNGSNKYNRAVREIRCLNFARVFTAVAQYGNK